MSSSAPVPAKKFNPKLKYDGEVPSWWEQDTVSRRVARRASAWLVEGLGVGAFPRAYDRAKHGTFDPRVNYTSTKPEPLLRDVKLSQLPEWVLTRPLNPFDWIRAVFRMKARWQFHYLATHHPNHHMPQIQAVYFFLIPAFAYLHYRHSRHNFKYKHH